MQTHYQNKWPNIGGGSVDYYTSADVYLKKWKGAFALNYGFNNKGMGVLKSQNIVLSYAQHFTVNDKFKIIPSLQVGYFERRLDVSSLTYGEYIQYLQSGFVNFLADPLPSTVKKQNIDFGSGLLFQYNKRFYGGLSAFHINQPDVGMWGAQKLPVLFNVHLSYNFILSEKTILQVVGKFTTQQKYQAIQLQTNAVFFKHFVCGLNYTRSQEPVVAANLGYRNNYLSAIIGYGYGVSPLYPSRRDVWELSLSYNLRNKENRKKLTAFEAW